MWTIRRASEVPDSGVVITIDSGEEFDFLGPYFGPLEKMVKEHNDLSKESARELNKVEDAACGTNIGDVLRSQNEE